MNDTPQALPYDMREALATIRELLDYDAITSDEVIRLEVRQRGIVVDPIWLREMIDRERERGGATCPMILAAYSPLRKMQCSDCRARDGSITQADFVILPDTSPDWKAVCEDCSNGYEWNEDTDF